MTWFHTFSYPLLGDPQDKILWCKTHVCNSAQIHAEQHAWPLQPQIVALKTLFPPIAPLCDPRGSILQYQYTAHSIKSGHSSPQTQRFCQ